MYLSRVELDPTRRSTMLHWRHRRNCTAQWKAPLRGSAAAGCGGWIVWESGCICCCSARMRQSCPAWWSSLAPERLRRPAATTRFCSGGAGQLLAVPADRKPHQKLQRPPKPRSAGNCSRTLHDTVPEAVAVGARRKARLCLREEEFTVTRVQWQHFAKHGTRPVTCWQ